jgi:hypothetical protein
MSYLESGAISQAEYDASREQRLPEASFIAGELYTAMFALRPNRQQVQAVKAPLRIENISSNPTALFVVRVALLDADLNSNGECDALFEGGYWVDVGSKVNVIGIAPRQSYLKPYEDTTFDDLGALWEELQQPAGKVLAPTG